MKGTVRLLTSLGSADERSKVSRPVECLDNTKLKYVFAFGRLTWVFYAYESPAMKYLRLFGAQPCNGEDLKNSVILCPSAC